jgi:hypothetical protein
MLEDNQKTIIIVNGFREVCCLSKGAKAHHNESYL